MHTRKVERDPGRRVRARFRSRRDNIPSGGSTARNRFRGVRRRTIKDEGIVSANAGFPAHSIVPVVLATRRDNGTMGSALGDNEGAAETGERSAKGNFIFHFESWGLF